MKITIEMPYVEECKVNDCAYNVKDKCHARAITIGNGVTPGCDTSLLGVSRHAREEQHYAGVGACKVTKCTFNQDYECSAESISVGFSGKQINCLTFEAS